MFLVESHVVRLTRVVELDSHDVVWGVHAHQVMHVDGTHTTLTFQHSLYVFTKIFHPWVIMHSNDHFTHCHQGFLSAPLPQAIMEALILIRASCDHGAITARNDSILFKFYHNGTDIHISDELVSEVVKNMFRCTEKREMLHTTCQPQMLVVGPPTFRRIVVCGDTVHKR